MQVTAWLLTLTAWGAAPLRAEAAMGNIIFFGDSLTAGYGLDEPLTESYPGVIAARIKAAELPFTVTNAGLSGETTAGGARRVNWVLRQPVAVFLLALGGNDGLRGIPTSETEKNLQTIIDAVRALHPRARLVLLGMQAPPNLGPEFTTSFREIYPRLAAENDLPLVPFLLEGVGGERGLNQRDGIHPTPEGQRVLADNVWHMLEPLLREMAAENS